MTHEFELSREITLDATPEEVWEAIATGPGIDSWFMGRNEVEPREGGVTRMAMGDFSQEGAVTAWEPGERFAFRGAEGPDGSVHAFEYLIEGREGGSTVLRLVHSGFMGDDWETEYEALGKGWGMYLDKLGEYFAYFRGRTATPVFATAPPKDDDKGSVMKVLERGLGLTGTPAVGDQVRLTPKGLPPIEGVVDYAAPDFLGVRTGDAMYRFIQGYTGGPVLGHHLFSDDVDEKESEKAWQSWLTGLFA